MCGAIRALVGELCSPEVADAVRVLYGGSVKSGNVAAIMSQPDVDGCLVGGRQPQGRRVRRDRPLLRPARRLTPAACVFSSAVPNPVP